MKNQTLLFNLLLSFILIISPAILPFIQTVEAQTEFPNSYPQEIENEESETLVEEENTEELESLDFIVDEIQEEVSENIETWFVDGSLARTNQPVELNVTYTAPQNEKVTVTFTSLPDESGVLTIEEIVLTNDQVTALNAVSNIAYDISVDMPNGTFTYDLTLPNQGRTNTEVKYAQTPEEVLQAIDVQNNEIENGDVTSITNLNHFTVFIVTTPIGVPVGTPGSDDCSVVGTAGTCYDTLYDATIAANANPGFDTIILKPGTYTNQVGGNAAFISETVELICEPGAIIDGNGTGTGILIQSNDVTITGCEITDFHYGIIANTFVTDGSTVQINNNVISGVAIAGLDFRGTGLLDATNNFWGDATGPLDTNATDGSVPADNPTGLGEEVRGAVDYRDTIADVEITSLNPLDSFNSAFTISGTGTVGFSGVSELRLTFFEKLPDNSDGVNYVCTTTLVSGLWSLDVNDGLGCDIPEEKYRVTARITNGFGEQDWDTVQPFYVDFTRPDFTVTSPSANSYISGGFSVSGTAPIDPMTDNGNENSGVQDLIIRFRDLDNGNTVVVLHEVILTGDPTWSVDFNGTGIAVPDGRYRVNVRSLDNAGNARTVTNNDVIIDNVDPLVSIDFLETRDRTPELTGTVNDTTANIEVTVDGSTYTATNNTDGTWTLADNTISTLADGVYEVEVTATDLARNIGTDATTNELLVDRTAPSSFSVNNVSDNAYISLETEYTITGSAIDALVGITDGPGVPYNDGIVLRVFNVGESAPLPAVYVEWATYDETTNTWTLPLDSTELADGTYDFRFAAYDKLGNARVAYFDNVLVDSVEPSTTMSSPVSSSMWNVPIPIIGETTDTGIVDYVELHYRTSSPIGVWTLITTLENTLSDEPFLWDYDWTPAADGVYDIRARGVDMAGNIETSAYAYNVTYDATAPVVEITAPNDGDTIFGTIDVFGSVTDMNPWRYYAVVRDTSNTVVAGPGTVYRSDSFTNELLYSWDTTTVPNGDYVIWLAARDELGNRDDSAGSLDTITVTVSNVGEIQGRKLIDDNADGNIESADTNEFRVDGWEISVYDSTWTLVSSMDTGDDTTPAGNVGLGQYRFEDLPFDTYYVCEAEQSGWIQTATRTGASFTTVDDPFATDPNQVCYEIVIDTPNQEAYGYQFGNFELGTVSGYKWIDDNFNGVWDTAESVFESWQTFLDLDLDGIYDTGEPLDSTNSSGMYEFTDLEYGVYQVCEDDVTGWVQTYPFTSCHSISINASGVTYTNVNFGNFELGTIQGSKWEDTNADGNWDLGENGIESWTIYLDQTINDTVDADAVSEVTLSDGSYMFEDLEYGTYEVCEELQPNWQQTYPSSTTCTVVAIDESGDVVADINFGNFEYGSITGYKWSDVNYNGIWDSGENALSGWKIIVNGEESLSANTGSDGLYTIEGLPFGTHQVCEVSQTNWIQTYPSFAYSGECHTFTIDQSGMVQTVNQSGGLLNFGNFEDYPVDIGIIVTPGIIGINETATLTAVVENNPTNNPISFVWSGDCSGTNQVATYTPNAPGTYSCTITASDINGDTDSGTVLITVDQPIVIITSDDENTETTNIGQAGSVAGENTENVEGADDEETAGNSVLGASTCSEEEFSDLSGFVFVDENANNSPDDGEGLNDIRVSVYVQDENGEFQLVTIVRTNESGEWVLEDICPGEYEARLRTSDLTENQEVSNDVLGVTVEANDSQDNVDFVISTNETSDEDSDSFNWILVIVLVLIGLGIIGGGFYVNSMNQDKK